MTDTPAPPAPDHAHTELFERVSQLERESQEHRDHRTRVQTLLGRVSPGYTEMRASTDYTVDTIHLFGLTYDGTALRAWLDGVAVGSASAAGEIDWGPGTGKWEIGSNGGGERPVSTIYRAGVEEAVWDASAWESFFAKARGLA